MSSKPWTYYLAYLVIICPVRLLPWFSWAFLGFVAYRHMFQETDSIAESSGLYLGFLLYATVEALFTVYQVHYYRQSQRIRKPPVLSAEEVRKLYQWCLESTTDFTECFPLWFYGASMDSIRRENVREWLAWAFFNAELDQLTQEQASFNAEMLDHLENSTGYLFPPGYATQVRCQRLNLDPVESMTRSIIFYVAIHLMEDMLYIFLKLYGFQKLHLGGMTYWLRKGTDPRASSKAKPVVFIHGIGAGIISYFVFLRHLFASHKLSPDQPILLLTVPHISMHLLRFPFAKPLSMMDTVSAVSKIFDRHELYQEAIWIGHSFGTVIVGWMVKALPQLVGRAILVDPVCFMLWEADVCYNFVYKKPRVVTELLMWFFVSKEVGIRWYLGRYFWWFENLLFPEQLARLKHDTDEHGASALSRTHVFLSSRDQIINAHRVGAYLKREGVPLTWMEGFVHADAILGDIHSIDAIIDQALKSELC